MRLLIRFSVMFLLAGFALALAQQRAAERKAPPIGEVSGPHIISPRPNHAFQNGDNYVYQAEWRLWNAGTVTLGLANSGNQVQVNGSAESRGFVSLLYAVHDRFQSAFDPKSFCSQSVRKHVEEGFHARETLITFDYARRKSVLEETNLKDKKTKRAENEIPGCVTDVLSAIYYLGSLPLAPEATYVFPLNDGGQTVNVTAKVEARETLKTAIGTLQTIRISPEAVGPLKSKGKIWIWYTDDERRIPVQMRGRMFWGTLTFKLQRIEKK